jgi:putative ATPase
VFTLRPLDDAQVEEIARRAMADRERGLGLLGPTPDSDALTTLVTLANGDARVALNALELATSATSPDESGQRRITAATVEDAMQQRALLYDRAGDQHYDTISAFIKCMRGSDPNAAIYWLARMIEAGENPLFIARRLVILAAEDVGMADPHALSVAVAAQQAVHFVGMPEGRIPLAEATVYLATAPKSNASYMAINKALEDVRTARNDPVPLHLRNPVTGLMKESGYGKGYKYSHDFEGNFAPMQNLPERLRGRRYYTPGDQGYETEVADRLARWWGEGGEPESGDGDP